jgi:fatty acid desaturase
MKKETTHFKIPNKLNLAIFSALCMVSIGLLKYSQYTEGIGFILCMISFGLIQTPIYSLLHEAMHNCLHSNEKINYITGNILGAIFIVPFTFIKHTHNTHHRQNRTDSEMIDMYYPGTNKFFKYSLYYSTITFYWILLPFLIILLAFFPKLIKSDIFLKDETIRGKIQNIENKFFHLMRKESVFIIIFQISMFFLLGLELKSYLLLYLAHGFIWSSQNYINHAYSPRHIKDGAHNHKLNKYLRYFILNFNYHKAHHQYPTIPWNHLDKFVDKNEPNRVNYLFAWLRQWKGPVMTTVPSPEVSSSDEG